MPRPGGTRRVDGSAPGAEPGAARRIYARGADAAQRHAAVLGEDPVGRPAGRRVRVCRVAREAAPVAAVGFIGMTNSAARACAIVFLALIAAAAACGRRQQAAERTMVKYSEPRFPSYLKPPLSIDEVLPHVR